MVNIGEKIKEYRNSLKMTQADFAYRLGVTGASVSAYETGTRLPSYDILVKIANILGVSTDALLGRQENERVTVDVTDLTTKQRRVLQETIDLFVECNKQISSPKSSSGKRTKLVRIQKRMELVKR